MNNRIEPVRWRPGALEVLDQRLLPKRVKHLRARTSAEVASAIRDMALRGAPLIGVAAAYGMALAPKGSRSDKALDLRIALEEGAQVLKASRPTAVALAWAVDRLLERAQDGLDRGRKGLEALLLAEARKVHRESVESDLESGRLGARLLPKNAALITYCNTGTLATAGIGTALGVVRQARRRGGLRMVYACETRPYLQGARLTAWELSLDRAPFRLITDNMAGHILATEKIDAVLVGADRIAANGDTANKIGTYPLAVLARRHRVPFYVVAPVSTIDPACPGGRGIPIEERSSAEVLSWSGRQLAPKGTRARHPAFDVTPASLITALVTEKGVVRGPTAAKVARLLAK